MFQTIKYSFLQKLIVLKHKNICITGLHRRAGYDTSGGWDAIAIDLKSLFSNTVDQPVVIKGKSCRERMERLPRNYKDDEAAARS